MKIAVTASPVTAHGDREPGRGQAVLIAHDGARAILAAFSDADLPAVVEVESWYSEPIPPNQFVGVEEIDGVPTVVSVFGPAKS